MSRLKHSIQGLMVGVLVGFGLMTLAPAAIAQTADGELDPLEGLSVEDGGDGFGADDPFNLIHRAILNPSMTSEDFQRQQQQRLNTEADAFRQRQREALQQQGLEVAPEAEAAE